MTEQKLLKLIDETLPPGEILPGVRASFYYEGIDNQEHPTFAKVRTNNQANPEVRLYGKPLLAVYDQLSEDPEYFAAGNRNHAFDELMRDSDIRHQDEMDPYPNLYKYESYYIALVEKFRSHISAAP